MHHNIVRRPRSAISKGTAFSLKSGASTKQNRLLISLFWIHHIQQRFALSDLLYLLDQEVRPEIEVVVDKGAGMWSDYDFRMGEQWVPLRKWLGIGDI